MTFSNEEKTIIGHILGMDRLSGPNCLANIWEKILLGVYINFTKEDGDGVPGLVFLNQVIAYSGDIEEFNKRLTSTILLIIDLLDRLEKEKLILPFTPDHEHWTLGSDEFELGHPRLRLDADLRRKLLPLVRREFGVSKSLHDLVDNNYMSDEAFRFQETMKKERRTLRWTQFALLVAIAAQIPAWIQLFIDKTAKVELTPASQVQVFSSEEAPCGAIQIPDREQTNAVENVSVVESADTAALTSIPQVKASFLEEIPEQEGNPPVEPTDTALGKGKPTEAPVPPPQPNPAGSSTNSTTTSSNKTATVEGKS